MSAVLTTQGAQYLLAFQLGKTTRGGQIVRLYTNDYQPARNANISLFEECTLSGYSPVTLVGSEWVYVREPDGATYSYPLIQWNFLPYSSPQVSIVGWYITDTDNTIPIWAEAFASPVPIPYMGVMFPLDLKWHDEPEDTEDV